MSTNSCCLWFLFCLVKIIGKVNTFKHTFMCIWGSIINESLICDCDGAEILRPWHFFIYVSMSIHNDILSSADPICPKLRKGGFVPCNGYMRSIAIQGTALDYRETIYPMPSAVSRHFGLRTLRTQDILAPSDWCWNVRTSSKHFCYNRPYRRKV